MISAWDVASPSSATSASSMVARPGVRRSRCRTTGEPVRLGDARPSVVDGPGQVALQHKIAADCRGNHLAGRVGVMRSPSVIVVTRCAVPAGHGVLRSLAHRADLANHRTRKRDRRSGVVSHAVTGASPSKSKR
jgi:hypothetical protein